MAATGLAQQKRAADLFKQAQVYEREQKYVAAESVYQEVLASDPDNPEALPPLCSEPQRLPTLQAAHYGYERLLFPRVDLVHPHLRQAGFRLATAHRSKQRRSMARTAGSKRRVTCRAEALSQASSTASSKRFENGALLGNCNNERGHF